MKREMHHSWNWLFFQQTSLFPEIAKRRAFELTWCEPGDSVTSLVPESISDATVAELAANDAGEHRSDSRSRERPFRYGSRKQVQIVYVAAKQFDFLHTTHAALGNTGSTN